MATIESLTLVSTGISYLPPAPDGRVRFSRQAYHRMFEIGVLDPEKRYELLDGEVVMSPPIGPAQGGLTSRLNEFFTKRLPDSIHCRVQLPIVAGDLSELEPDLALVRAREDYYQAAHPRPEEVMLLVEVAQSSLVRDRGQKMQIYARSGIPEYWIVDVEHRLVIVHREAGPLGYADVQQYKAPATVASPAVPECQLDLGWLFR
jgi:Uma2 family endonuclease